MTDARLALAEVDRRARLAPEPRRLLAEADRLNQRVIDLYGQGKSEAALEPARRALEIRKQVLGERHPDYATSLNNLAWLYQAMGDDVRAEPLYRQALEIRKQVLGEHHPDYAHSLNNLAALYKSLGDYARAEPLYRQALEIRKQVLGERHPDYAHSLNNLAALYDDMGDYARAEPLLRQALEIRKQVLGEHHPDYATSLNNLAWLYQAMGDDVRAEPLYRQALEIRKQVLGEHHPDYAHSLNNLAMLYWSQGDPARAETYLKQGLGIARDLLDVTALAQSERQQLAMIQSWRYLLDVYLSLAPEANQNGDAVYRHLLTWKGAVFLRQRELHKLRGVAHEPAQSEVGQLATELVDVARQLGKLAFATPDPKSLEGRRRRMEELTDRKERLEGDLARRSTGFRAGLARARMTPAQVQAALPRDAALIDFLEYRRFRPSPEHKGRFQQERHLAAFVVCAGPAGGPARPGAVGAHRRGDPAVACGGRAAPAHPQDRASPAHLGAVGGPPGGDEHSAGRPGWCDRGFAAGGVAGPEAGLLPDRGICPWSSAGAAALAGVANQGCRGGRWAAALAAAGRRRGLRGLPRPGRRGGWRRAPGGGAGPGRRPVAVPGTAGHAEGGAGGAPLV